LAANSVGHSYSVNVLDGPEDDSRNAVAGNLRDLENQFVAGPANKVIFDESNGRVRLKSLKN